MIDDNPFPAVVYQVTRSIRLENRDPNSDTSDWETWAICRNGCTFGADGEWELEPQPSSRDEDYLYRHRYSLCMALTAIKLNIDKWRELYD
jgi:hypothetical protein